MGVIALAVIVIGSLATMAWYYGPSLTGGFSTTRKVVTPSTGGGSTTHQNNSEMVSVLLNFGNGTRVWYNDTTVPSNYDFYNVTYQVTNGNVVADWDDLQKSEFVFEIMGYGCHRDQYFCGGYWSLWVWNQDNGCWNYSIVGISSLKVSQFRMIAWVFAVGDTGTINGRCP